MFPVLSLLALAVAYAASAAPIADVPVSLLTEAQINLVRERMIEGSQAR